MSLISLDNLSMIIDDLNKEIRFKIYDNDHHIPDDMKFLSLHSDGDDHEVRFMNEWVWSSKMEKKYDHIPPRKEIEMNERTNFEAHLRRCINDKIDILRCIQL